VLLMPSMLSALYVEARHVELMREARQSRLRRLASRHCGHAAN
jgi:hypothetical protein